jgi:hypothetical protein
LSGKKRLTFQAKPWYSKYVLSRLLKHPTFRTGLRSSPLVKEQRHEPFIFYVHDAFRSAPVVFTVLPVWALFGVASAGRNASTPKRCAASGFLIFKNNNH